MLYLIDMRLAKVALAIATVSFLTGSGNTEERTLTESGEWQSLFNGKDLTGWTPKFKGHDLGVNAKNTFRVEDGLLKVSYENYEEWGSLFGHLFYERELSHYKLRVEYRFVGEQVSEGPALSLIHI